MAKGYIGSEREKSAYGIKNYFTRFYINPYCEEFLLLFTSGTLSKQHI